MGNSQLLILYKIETGKDARWVEFGAHRSKGRWILDVDDEEMFATLGRNFCIDIPDMDYIVWMEEKVLELLNQ